MRIDVNEIKAGSYELLALRWDEILSKPGQPLDFRRHRRGDTVRLSVEDARRLVLAGAVKKKGDDDQVAPLDGPSTPPGETPDPADVADLTTPPTPQGALTGDPLPPVEQDPTRHKPADVKAYVGEDAEKAAAVLELERAGAKPRPTLVKWLEEIATNPAGDGGTGGSTGSATGGDGSGSGSSQG